MPKILTSPICLIADIGGTNARFAILNGDNQIDSISVLQCSDYPGILNAIESYLDQQQLTGITHAAIAVATPVNTDRIKFTNNAWSFSISDLKAKLELEFLNVINDFTAQALAIPLLTSDQVVKTGGGEGVDNANIAVIGPGTGLGVSGLVLASNQWHPVTGEGGHVSFYPSTRRGLQVVGQLGEKYEHVSAERVVSGQGILNIYSALCKLENRPVNPDMTAAQIAGNATNKECSLSIETMELFFDMLGTVAGNLVLTLGAQKGVYIAGGIVPKNRDLFLRSRFRQAFEAHGRFRDYLETTPSYLVTYPYVALTGLSSLFIK